MCFSVNPHTLVMKCEYGRKSCSAIYMMVKMAASLCLRRVVEGLGMACLACCEFDPPAGPGYTQEGLGSGGGDIMGRTGHRNSGKWAKNLLGQSA